jgi:hypothetical protein
MMSDVAIAAVVLAANLVVLGGILVSMGIFLAKDSGEE